jgi:hypothetical protein
MQYYGKRKAGFVFILKQYHVIALGQSRGAYSQQTKWRSYLAIIMIVWITNAGKDATYRLCQQLKVYF